MGRYRDLTDAEIKELNELLNLLVKRKKLVYREPKLLKGEQNSSKRRPRFKKKRRLLNFKTSLSFVSKKLCRHLVN
jgi:hypothetical protein